MPILDIIHDIYPGNWCMDWFTLQIRIESAISTKVEPSTKCLGLISLMKNIQKGWVGLLVSTPTMTSNIIDNMEEKVIGHVEEKMKLPMGIKEDLLCFRRFCTLKNRLEYVCNGDANTTPGTKAIQGMLIKELVQVFCDSVEKDMAHRDHIFIHELVTKTVLQLMVLLLFYNNC